jgi:hypothetical protein
MKCSFCENELTVDMLRKEGCGGCFGGCRKIHCPYCGQENPIVPELLEKLVNDDKHTGKKGSTE